uniref:Uncharacterized protein n=1 Tax=Oryzias sinensis TaxID=183150 RepID=A0A8C8DF93_9TELE
MLQKPFKTSLPSFRFALCSLGDPVFLLVPVKKAHIVTYIQSIIDIYFIISERPSASDSCCPLHPPTAIWQQRTQSLFEQLYSAQDNR